MKTRHLSLWALMLLTLTTACSKEQVATNRAEQMRELITELSHEAKRANPDFLVLVQNSPEVAYEDGLLQDPEFMGAVDGFTGEVVFYDGAPSSYRQRLDDLEGLPDEKWILVLDPLSNESDRLGFMDSCAAHGFIGFPRVAPVTDYSVIPDSTPDAHTRDVTRLCDAQNALVTYNPDFQTSQELLDALRATDFDVLIIDPDFNTVPLTGEEVTSLKSKALGGSRLVLAYLNLGAAERWRYYFEDKWKLHNPDLLRQEMDNFEGEYYVKYWTRRWHEIMYAGKDAYIHRLIDAGYDGVLLDNVEAFRIGKWAEEE